MALTLFNREQKKQEDKLPAQILSSVESCVKNTSCNPTDMRLLEILAGLTPEDNKLREYISFVGQQQVSQLTGIENDPFIENYPPLDTVLTDGRFINIGQMATDDTLPFPLDKVAAGTIVVGLPGSGKTNLSKIKIVQLVSSDICVVVWDTKGTWKNLAQIPELQNKTIVLKPNDIKWSLLQPPPKTSLHEWANRITNLIAQAYERISAQRMLREVIDELLKDSSDKCYPTPRVLIQKLNSLKLKNFKDKDYASSLLWVLKDIDQHFQDCFEYTQSDFADRLFSQSGRLIIVENQGMPIQHWNFLVCLFEEYNFVARKNNSNARNFDILHVLEDSTSLIDPARDRSTPGGVSLIAQNLNLCREMRIGMMIICHSLQQVSPKVMNNIDSFFVCSLRGDNVSLASQILGLTPQQAQYMRINPRGTTCALIPSVWPRPVLIKVPCLVENL